MQQYSPCLHLFAYKSDYLETLSVFKMLSSQSKNSLFHLLNEINCFPGPSLDWVWEATKSVFDNSIINAAKVSNFVISVMDGIIPKHCNLLIIIYRAAQQSVDKCNVIFSVMWRPIKKALISNIREIYSF